MSKIFYDEIEDKSTIISDKWEDFIENDWQDYYGFEATTLSSEVWEQEKVLKLINSKFPFKHVGIIKIPANYNYNWHVDHKRGCGINMLLQHEESHTLFRKSGYKNNYNRNASFVELKYKPNTFYIFNTQKSHCILNFGKPRYLFTCEFLQDVDELSYARARGWMEKNNLLKTEL